MKPGKMANSVQERGERMEEGEEKVGRQTNRETEKETEA